MITTQKSITSATKGQTLRLSVRDVTGTHVADVDIDRSLPVETVAQTVAARLSLPDDTAWALRQERTAAFLDDATAIGEAVADRTELVVTPRAHLGSAPAPGSAPSP